MRNNIEINKLKIAVHQKSTIHSVDKDAKIM